MMWSPDSNDGTHETTMFPRSFARLPRFLVLTSLLIGLWLGAMSRRAHEVAVDPPQPLLVPECDLNFGSVWADPSFQWTLPITNVTDEACLITEFKTSCGCSRVDPQVLAIPAHETRRVTLTIDLTANWRDLNVQRQDVGIEVRPVIKGRAPLSAPWNVNGTAITAWRLSPASITLESMPEAHASLASAVAEVIANLPMAELHASYNVDVLAVGIMHHRAVNGARVFQVSIAIRDGAPVGRHTERVNLRGLGKNGDIVGGLPLSVRARVFARIRAVPDRVDFGARALGEVATDAITLRGTEDPSATVEVAVSDARGLLVLEETPSQRSGGRTFRIEQRAIELGDRAAELRFLVHAPRETEPVVINVPVSYFGTASRESGLVRSSGAEGGRSNAE